MNTVQATPSGNTHAVIGAFGYSGAHIARALLANGQNVVTLTSSPPDRHELSSRVHAFPLDFNCPGQLEESMFGVSVLYNTYWVRFNHRRFNHDRAVANSMTLFKAAKSAGVERVVHISITNPSLESPLSYFRGKALVERALQESGISHAILRPAVLFGGGDILINNIAWALRVLPVFGVFGDGSYRLRPIHVDDFAAATVKLGRERSHVVVDAVGPEVFSYRELVETTATNIGVRRTIIGVPNRIGWIAGKALGMLHRDVTITMDEIRGLTAGLLDVDSDSIGDTKLTEWLRSNRETIGLHYASEMARRANE